MIINPVYLMIAIVVLQVVGTLSALILPWRIVDGTLKEVCRDEECAQMKLGVEIGVFSTLVRTGSVRRSYVTLDRRYATAVDEPQHMQRLVASLQVLLSLAIMGALSMLLSDTSMRSRTFVLTVLSTGLLIANLVCHFVSMPFNQRNASAMIKKFAKEENTTASIRTRDGLGMQLAFAANGLSLGALLLLMLKSQ